MPEMIRYNSIEPLLGEKLFFSYQIDKILKWTHEYNELHRLREENIQGQKEANKYYLVFEHRISLPIIH